MVKAAWETFRSRTLGTWADRDAGPLLRILILAAFLLVLTAALPGHLSTDSVIQLAEGRKGLQRSFNPAFMSWFLGVLDGALSGPSLFVLFDMALFFVGLVLMTRLAPRVRWYAVPVALLVVLTPQVLVYQGIVWKDVFFANSAIAGFVALAWVARRWDDARARIWPWTVALVLFVVAALVRQNGILALMAGAAALGVVAFLKADGWREGLQRGLAAFGLLLIPGVALMGVVTAALDKAIPYENPNTKGVGFRIIQHYDIVGVLAHDPQAPLEPLTTFNAASAATIRSEAPRVYSPERVDKIGESETIGPAFWSTPGPTMSATWKNLVAKDFSPYAAHRLAVFREAFLTPKLAACLPVHTGIQGPADVLAELNLPARQDARDFELSNYASQFYGSPVYSHLTFAILAVVLIGLLLMRRSATDWVICALLASGLAFAGSFLLIALACDYRYLYYLDLSALVGLLYVALDPPVPGVFRRLQSKSGLSE